MSDNNLSIDEIIKKAEQIKAQAEKQLMDAQKNLDEMAKSAINEVTVDSDAVMKRVEELSNEEDDIKEFNPVKKTGIQDKTKTVRISFDKKTEKTVAFKKFNSGNKQNANTDNYDDDDIKIADNIGTDDEDDIFEHPIVPNEKTKTVVISANS